MGDDAGSRAFVVEGLRRLSEEAAAQKAWERRGKERPIQRPMRERWPS